MFYQNCGLFQVILTKEMHIYIDEYIKLLIMNMARTMYRNEITLPFSKLIHKNTVGQLGSLENELQDLNLGINIKINIQYSSAASFSLSIVDFHLPEPTAPPSGQQNCRLVIELGFGGFLRVF